MKGGSLRGSVWGSLFPLPQLSITEFYKHAKLLSIQWDKLPTGNNVLLPTLFFGGEEDAVR